MVVATHFSEKITGNFDGNFAVLPFRFLFFKNFFLKPIDKVGILVYIIFDPHPVGEVWREKEKRKRSTRGNWREGKRLPNTEFERRK